MKISDGFIIVDKEKGCTSHDCVKEIRKILGIKKVGHTGTLDPQVTGILPLAIGNATRFIQYLPQRKIYLGQIQLGIRTTTDDIQGEVINKKNWPIMSSHQLNKYLDNFRGLIKQVPPNVSSVHINGERAYKKFLKNEEFVLTAKEVHVHELVLKNWNQKNGVLEIKISCSSGTYIRSIARDLGKVLYSEGCLLCLKRINACGFDEKNSIKISDLKKLKEKNSEIIIPTIYALDHISTLVLTEQMELNFWRTGREIELNNDNFLYSAFLNYKKPIKIIDSKKNLLGIGFINPVNNNLKPKLVLNAK